MMSTLQHSKSVERDSNMELLRLVLMCLIVLHHGVVHGLNLEGLRLSSCILQEQDFLPACILNSLCIIAVNTFLLISGYYSIRTTKNKFTRLILLVFIYTLLFSTSFILIKGGFRSALFSLLLFSHSRYWFILDYLVLMVLAPAINLFFDNTTQKKKCLFVIALIFISCYLGFIWHFEANVNGYTVFQFITLYSVGKYIHDSKIHLEKIPALIIYLLCSIALTLIMLFLHKSGHDERAWLMTYYNNPILIVSAIAFFFFFKNLKIRNTKINRISASSLSIYLFTSSAFVENCYYSFISSAYTAHRECIFLTITACTLLLSTTAILIDKLLLSKLVERLHKGILSIKPSKVSLS